MGRHPAPGHHSGTLVNALLGLGRQLVGRRGRERPGIVHRLDKGTSGLIVAARNDRRIARSPPSSATARSAARTHDRPRSHQDQCGELEGPIGRHPKERKRMAVVKGGRFARHAL